MYTSRPSKFKLILEKYNVNERTHGNMLPQGQKKDVNKVHLSS